MAVSGTVASSAATATATAATARLHALLLCDLVDSTGLIERLGDAPAADLIRQHDRLARDCLQRHGGREIDKTDGFLLLFERPIQAVAFALDYTDALQHLAEASRQPLHARVGIHVGEVLLWRNDAADIADGAKPVEVEGIAKAIAARLMGLARPGQILLSDTARMLAQRAAGELGSERTASLRWLAHGRYRLKGVDAPMPVHEVGARDHAPLRAPPSADKARRLLPWWKTRWAQAAALLAVLCIPLAMLMGPEPAIAFQERDWVLLGDVRNLTGDLLLDDSLQSALRISLEQSRHVNVLSELLVRDAVRRMNLDPAATQVDRTIGSELAVREGARALLLPTVAEVGGRVRVSLEVVDPHTQTTVYSEAADGHGTGSTLESMDIVTRRLRQRLAEPLSEIEATSSPLPKVTTGSIEALRAYALANKAFSHGRWNDAYALFEQALALDPAFDLARLGLARVHLSGGNALAALDQLDRIDLGRERLTLRYQLYFDALHAWSRALPELALTKWRLLGEMYPDHHGAFANYASVAADWLNRYEDAQQVGRLALAPGNPMIASTHQTLAQVAIARNDFALARAELEAALAAGGSERNVEHFNLAAATGNFARAAQLLSGNVPPTTMTMLDWRHLGRIALLLDQERWMEAAATIEQQLADADLGTDLAARALLIVQLQMYGARLPHARRPAALDAALASIEPHAASSTPMQRHDAVFAGLAIGIAAAQAGEAAVAEQAIERFGGPAHSEGYPNLQTLQAMLQAELALAGGEPERAARLLLPRIDGHELYLAHAVLLRVQDTLGDNEAGTQTARWLASHRGRAYAEFNAQRVLQPANVLAARLAARRVSDG